MSERKMSMKDLIHLANNLFEQAMDAYTYRCVLKQFKENAVSRKEEMSCSVGFYNIIYHSLVNSLMLFLTRIYDDHSDSLSIKNLITGMREITEADLDSQMQEQYNLCGKKFRHRLKPVEERFYEKEVCETKWLLSTFGLEYSATTVELSLEDYIRLYQKRYGRLKKSISIKNLHGQRNKIVAHNDSEVNFDFERVFNTYPITNDDIDELLDFAIDCTQFVKVMLTGTYTVPEIVNVDDWESTLQLVHIGLKYEDAYIADQLDNNDMENQP